MRIVGFGWLPVFKILFICSVTEIDAEEREALCSFSPFLPFHSLLSPHLVGSTHLSSFKSGGCPGLLAISPRCVSGSSPCAPVPERRIVNLHDSCRFLRPFPFLSCWMPKIQGSCFMQFWIPSGHGFFMRWTPAPNCSVSSWTTAWL